MENEGKSLERRTLVTVYEKLTTELYAIKELAEHSKILAERLEVTPMPDNCDSGDSCDKTQGKQGFVDDFYDVINNINNYRNKIKANLVIIDNNMGERKNNDGVTSI